MFSEKRREGVLKSALVGLTVCVAAATAFNNEASAAWPEKDVTLLVHSKAGSSTDVMARAIAKAIENVTGKNVVVVVKGRDALIALQKAKADGYTLATQTRSFLGSLASGRSHFPAEDFQWVSRLIGETYALGVRADSPWKTAQDLIEDAKKRPGDIKLSTFRPGSTHQISALSLAKEMGTDFNVIPYDSGSKLVIAMLGGNVDVAGTNPSRLIEYMTAGKARALVVMSDKRHDKMPDVPTARELGFPIEQYHWRGLVGKSGIPEQTLKEIDAVMEKVAREPSFVEYVEKEGLDMLVQGHAELSASVESEIVEVKKIMTELGLIK